MDRIIKFRVWDKDNNCFIQYADLDEININFQKKGKIGILNLSENFRTQMDEDDSDNFVLQQFTGLQDKNGKDIYEGDILKMAGELVGMVKFTQGQSPSFAGQWQVEYATWVLVKFKAQDYTNSYHLSVKEYREIIGNIFENPDLIK